MFVPLVLSPTSNGLQWGSLQLQPLTQIPGVSNLPLGMRGPKNVPRPVEAVLLTGFVGRFFQNQMLQIFTRPYLELKP